jgi:poly(3-hydroxybutyrate) depolymerase
LPGAAEISSANYACYGGDSPLANEVVMNRILLWCLCVACLPCLAVAADRQQPVTFSQTICQDVTLRHLLSLPQGYDDDPGRAWPLILFLHGSGERGNELDRVKVNGLPKELAVGREVPAIVLSPQCPADARWDSELMVAGLDALLDDALARYRVDPRRVYVTGLSMGGFGTWALAAAHPERFAAIAPVCGGGDPDLAVRLRRVPIWAFHGAKDAIVPLAAMQTMTDAMARVHGDMRTTTYPDAGHDSWSTTYADPDLYTWLLQYEKTEPRLVRPQNAVLTASSGDPAKAFDGDLATRWESEWTDPQWLQIDLGAATPLRRLVLIWETAHGRVYEVLASADGKGDWTTIAAETNGDGAVDVIDLPDGFTTRFLKLVLTERGTEWGYSIWEIELESP